MGLAGLDAAGRVRYGMAGLKGKGRGGDGWKAGDGCWTLIPQKDIMYIFLSDPIISLVYIIIEETLVSARWSNLNHPYFLLHGTYFNRKFI